MIRYIFKIADYPGDSEKQWEWCVFKFDRPENNYIWHYESFGKFTFYNNSDAIWFWMVWV